MAWVQIIDSDANGTTPEPYTDTQGHSTTMTVTGSHTVEYVTASGPLAGSPLENNWIIGNEGNQAERHTHIFSEPVHVLRIDIHYLNGGDAANFAVQYEDGTSESINLQNWQSNGDAVIDLATDHSIQTGIPGNSSISVIRGSTPNNGTEGGTTTAEFYFPAPVTHFSVGKNSTNTTGNTDAYGYELYYDDATSVTCFTSGTLIETAEGQLPIELLKVGDTIRTLDNGYQEIRWIGATKVTGEVLARNSKLLPVRIKAGALGLGLPERDLIVSRQHRLLVRSKIAQQMFGTMEVLIPAIKLVGYPGIEIAEDIESVTYWHILFDRHEVIFAEGAPTESLFTGPEALKGISPEARQEIETLFPELEELDYVAKSVRFIPTKGVAIRQLIEGHKKNCTALQ